LKTIKTKDNNSDNTLMLGGQTPRKRMGAKVWLLIASVVGLLAVGVCIAFWPTQEPPMAPVNPNGNGWLTVSIDDTAPTVGTPLSVSYDESLPAQGAVVSYQWLRGDRVLSCTARTYTPTEKDVEQWLTVCVLVDGTEAGRDSIYFSELPVCYITTDDGEPVLSKTENKAAALFIQGNAAYEAQYDGNISIHARGNSTFEYDKKPYKIKLDKKTDLFGFGKSKHYVLLANYVDESLMRTAVGVELEKILGIPYSECIWVDVVLNGTYVGNYQLCEQVRVGKNILDIFDWDTYAEDTADAIFAAVQADDPAVKKSAIEEQMKGDLSWVDTGIVSWNGKAYDVEAITGEKLHDAGDGYLMEFTYKEGNEEYAFLTAHGVPVTVNSPKGIAGSETMLAFVQQTMQEAEDALRSENGYNAVGRHYSEYFDVDAMVNYWLLAELSGGRDNLRGSIYCYIDENGLITFGPGWDFDLFNRSSKRLIATEIAAETEWMVQVTDDPYFQVKAQERYWEIRDAYAALFEKGGWYVQSVDAISSSIKANRKIWRYEDIGPVTLLMNGEVYMRHFFANRIAWADRLFADEKKVTETLCLETQAHPYVVSSALAVSLTGVCPDTSEYGADYLYDAAAPIAMQITANCPTADAFVLYCNGKIVCTMDAADVAGPLELGADWFTEPCGKKNVLVLTAYDAAGNRLASNYVTVIAADRQNGNG